MKIIFIPLILILTGCSSLMETADNIEFTPKGWNNGIYNEVGMLRMLAEKIVIRLDAVIKYKIPEAVTDVIISDSQIQKPIEIALATTLKGVITSVKTAFRETATSLLGQFQNHLIGGGVGMALLTMLLAFLKKRERLKVEEEHRKKLENATIGNGTITGETNAQT